jgi:phosphoribosylaminoimidazole-succinocarboxamide synthase
VATVDLPLLSSGKVRDMYAMGDSILMVASDRISTYDVVHPTPIPDKGRVLTGISVAWFELTQQIVANHMLAATVPVPAALRGRALVVRRLEMLPVECVVRGYLTGSGWKDYQATGAVCGIELPPGLIESERLPQPIFTPASKAEIGEHDENISFESAVATLGDLATAERLREISLALYELAAAHALERGIILADTKFEFGLDASGVLTLGDEALTPDSSRFWPVDGYQAGRGQPSFDKLEPNRTRAGDPRRGRRPHTGPLYRGLRADRRTSVRHLARADRRTGRGPRHGRVVRARVLVRPKDGILDPQGQAVERALPALGFEGVRNVHVGRLIELDVDDPSRLGEMCERLLANPLVEDYEVLVDHADDQPGSA